MAIVFAIFFGLFRAPGLPHPLNGPVLIPLAWINGNCSGVGQTSGLPVHGASGSVNLVRSEHRARGPANRQTRGLPHPPT
jgi:hypothetical protein